MHEIGVRVQLCTKSAPACNRSPNRVAQTSWRERAGIATLSFPRATKFSPSDNFPIGGTLKGCSTPKAPMKSAFLSDVFAFLSSFAPCGPDHDGFDDRTNSRPLRASVVLPNKISSHLFVFCTVRRSRPCGPPAGDAGPLWPPSLLIEGVHVTHVFQIGLNSTTK